MKITINIRDAVSLMSDAEKIQMIRDIDEQVGTIGFSMDVIKALSEELRDEGCTKAELRKLI